MHFIKQFHCQLHFQNKNITMQSSLAVQGHQLHVTSIDFNRSPASMTFKCNSCYMSPMVTDYR